MRGKNDKVLDGRKFPKSGNKVVHYLDFQGSDEALLEALNNNENGAKRALYYRYSTHIQKVLVRIMGVDDSIPDLLQETFVQAYSSIGSVRNASSLKAWLSRIAVFVARARIRKRQRRRVFKLFSPTDMEDIRSEEMDTEGRQALKVLYAVLDELPVDERIVFAFRFIEGLGFTEIGELCSVSRATLNRRLTRAEEKFVLLARGEPLLAEWIERGTRWQI